ALDRGLFPEGAELEADELHRRRAPALVFPGKREKPAAAFPDDAVRLGVAVAAVAVRVHDDELLRADLDVERREVAVDPGAVLPLVHLELHVHRLGLLALALD